MTQAWNYNADRRLFDRIKSTTTDGCIKVSSSSYTFRKSDYVGIIKGSTIDLFVDLWQATFFGPQSYYYQGSPILGHTALKDGKPIFYAYPEGTYGKKRRWEAFKSQSQVYQERPAGLSPQTTSAFSVAVTPNADSVEGKLNIQRLSEIAGRPLNGDVRAPFADEVRRHLQSKGYSSLEINAYLRARTSEERNFIDRVAEQNIRTRSAQLNGTAGGAGGGGSGGGKRSSNGSNDAALLEPVSLPQLETRLVVRMPAGYLPPTNLDSITRPALNQQFTDESGTVVSLTYQFDYVPSNIRYSGLSSEWVEIPRAENYPFVDWGRYQLMNVSMSWIIAYDRVEPGGATVHDGIFRSVDSSINTLRTMARNKYPVSIVNMDDLLSVQMRRSETTGEVRGMQFVITDLNITAARRTTDPATGKPTTPSRISVAQCEMTLQEIPVESVQIASLPNISIPGLAPSNPRTNRGIPSLPDPGFISLSGPRQVVPEALNTGAGP